MLTVHLFAGVERLGTLAPLSIPIHRLAFTLLETGRVDSRALDRPRTIPAVRVKAHPDGQDQWNRATAFHVNGHILALIFFGRCDAPHDDYRRIAIILCRKRDRTPPVEGGNLHCFSIREAPAWDGEFKSGGGADSRAAICFEISHLRCVMPG